MIIQYVSVVWTCFQCSNTSALKWFHTIGFSITRQLSYQHVHHHDLGQLTRIPNSSHDACYCSRKASVCFHVHSQYWHILATILNGGTGDQLTWWRHCVCVCCLQWSNSQNIFTFSSVFPGKKVKDCIYLIYPEQTNWIWLHSLVLTVLPQPTSKS